MRYLAVMLFFIVPLISFSQIKTNEFDTKKFEPLYSLSFPKGWGVELFLILRRVGVLINPLTKQHLIIINQFYFSGMNNKTSIIYLILIITSFFFGCRGPVKEGNIINATASSVPMGQKFIIDTQESVVTWIGATILASKEEHLGYVHISKGELMIEKNQLVGGTVKIDMNTIEYGDKKNTNTPVNHLKSPDYFDVEKFPVSTIVIIRVDSVSGKTINITGNLTIKGITRPVNFPAEIEVMDGIVKANGKLSIDRTDWGIRYRSGKFYDIVADEIVLDDIEFHMKIVAKNK